MARALGARATSHIEVMARRVSVAEYLAAEQVATTKLEFLNGTVVAMPGESRNHLLITPRISHPIQSGLGDRSCVYLDQDVPPSARPDCRFGLAARRT